MERIGFGPRLGAAVIDVIIVMVLMSQVATEIRRKCEAVMRRAQVL